MLEQPPPMMDPKLQLPQAEFRPAGRTQRPRSNRRKSSGAGANANTVAAQSGRVNAVGIPAQYMQPVSSLCDFITFTVCTSLPPTEWHGSKYTSHKVTW